MVGGALRQHSGPQGWGSAIYGQVGGACGPGAGLAARGAGLAGGGRVPALTPPPFSPWVPLRLALAGAWHALRGRSLGQFPRVLRVLEAVGRAAPAALHFRHWARLRLGLQAAVSTPPPLPSTPCATQDGRHPTHQPVGCPRWPTPFPAPPRPNNMADALPIIP